MTNIQVTVTLDVSPTLVRLLPALAEAWAPAPPVATPPKTATNGQATNGSWVGNATVAAAAPKRKKRVYSTNVWTLERLAVLRREWPKGTPTPDIYKLVSGMPGKPLKIAHLSVKAAAIGVRRPPT